MLGLMAPLLALLIGAAHAQEVHTPFCLFGCPLGTPATNDLIVRSIYALSSNDETKFADWVAYRVTKETIGPTKERVWRADPALSASETLEPSDYEGANEALGIDRGHQAPLASFTSTNEWEATNFLSNITPQRSALNQGPWERLESAERSLARRAEVAAVFVLTGPLYEEATKPLPGADENHRIPSGYWKVVAVETHREIKTMAFIMVQSAPRGANFCDYVETISTVEKRSGLQLFPDAPSKAREALHTMPGTLSTSLGCADG